mmetsp:Transcript_11057/g.33258  ORF Transcript_11057/g.33258 Transcript_11057/m.33258 type:complete len:275 (-) Transcript_11057:573-1397(-)
MRRVREAHALKDAALHYNRGDLAARVAGNAQRLDLAQQRRPGALVELRRHEVGRHLQDVGLLAQVVDGLGRLQAQEPATDDHRGLRGPRKGDHGLEVLDGAVDEDAPHVHVEVLDGRHEGVRARADHAGVVGDLLRAAGGHGLHQDLLGLAVDALRPDAGADRHLVLLRPLPLHHRELPGVAVLEVLREVHPVIGHARLLAQHGDVQRAVAHHAHEFHHEVVAHRPMAHHHDPAPGELHARTLLADGRAFVRRRALARPLLAQLGCLQRVLEAL